MSKNQALVEFVLRHGDNNLILGHRLSEWCSYGPFMEEDIALTNIALDHLGAARMLLTYAGELEGAGRTEDDFAYLRTHEQFTNALLVEQPNGDFGDTQARQLFYSTFAQLVYTELQKSKNETLAAFATKAIKETAYHLRHCSEWVIRLGDGTEESKQRMQKGIDNLWKYTGDLFATTASEAQLAKDGIIPDVASLKSKWYDAVKSVVTQATLTMPDANAFMQSGSREGRHTEHLSYIVGEMQAVTRVYPGAKW
jgi:ring-1,2-phenylacetyl-CoA epoxidase subunit PaaC